MFGFFEQFNTEFAGLRLDPDRDVVGEMLAEKYGIRFRDRDGEIEFRFLDRPLRGGEDRRYRASVGLRLQTGTEDVIQSFYMKHWTENGGEKEPAAVLLTDAEFLRGIAVLQEYLEAVTVRDGAAESRWLETA